MEKLRIKDIGLVLTGNTPSMKKPEFYCSKDICFVKPSDLYNNKIKYVNQSEFYLSNLAKSAARIVPPYSILYTCIGSIGKIGINTMECAFNQQINAIIVDNNKCDTKYLAYLLLYKQNDFENIANNAVVPIINKTTFENVEIQINTLEEQKVIVNKLSCIEGIIGKYEIELNYLDQLIHSKFHEMFDNMPKCKLEDISNIIMGQSPDGSTYNNDEGVLFYQGKTFFEDIYIKDSGIYTTKPTRIAKENDVLLSVRAPVGAVNIARQNCCIGRGLAAIEPIEHKSGTLFLFFALKDKEQELSGMGVGSTFKAINKIEVHNIMIPKASMQAQELFEVFAKNIIRLKETIVISIKKLEDLKKAQMKKYFG